MPEGLRNLGAFVLRYNNQAVAYLMLLTDSYPYASPRLEGARGRRSSRPASLPDEDSAV